MNTYAAKYAPNYRYYFKLVLLETRVDVAILELITMVAFFTEITNVQ